MLQVGEKMKESNEKNRKNMKAWILLSTSFAFMLSFFAPLDVYYSNKDEFWFSVWQVVGIALMVFIIAEAILLLISYFLCNTGISIYCYTFLTFLMVYLYIQGNYIPRNYGVLNGANIDWDKYIKYGTASLVLAFVCLILCGIVIIKFKKMIFSWGSGLSIFILLIQIVTLLTLVIQDAINMSNNDSNTKVVTDNKMLNLSENSNIIVFILDTFDGEYFNYLLDTDYNMCLDVFEDFTYYKDTLGAYPTTKGALPQILTGVWYENEMPYADYVENAYMNNDIYKCLETNAYSVGIYTDRRFLSSDIDKYENVELGTYKIGNKLDFINNLYKMVAFNYAPHQWKKMFFYDSSDFESQRELAAKHSAYSEDVQAFESKLNIDGIDASEKNNCFRLYHLEGTHAPYTFGENLVTDENIEYTPYDEAAGCCMLVKKYIDKLKDLGIYDNTAIVIMADHGGVGYSQNPIYLVKNKNEIHDFRISEIPMSYEYLPNIWTALIGGEMIDETFVKSCKGMRENRRFLYYAWDNSWNRDYLPIMSEAFANGPAYETKNIMFSGMQFDSEKQVYPYTLGQELVFTNEATANPYCISGFSANEGHGTWTNDEYSILGFDIKGEKYNNLLLTIESGIFGSQQEVLVYVYDHQIADVSFAGFEKKELIIPKEYVKDGAVRIVMKFPDAVVPRDVDENNKDSRKLALYMRSVKLESTDQEINIYDQFSGGYALGTILSFSKTENTAEGYCSSGFSPAEEDFTWTNSKTANMSFLILDEKSSDFVLEYTCIPFNGKQHIILYANDQKIADYNETGEETAKITIPAEYIQEGELNLRFELPDAKSPKELGMGEDARTLGLAMGKLVISAAE